MNAVSRGELVRERRRGHVAVRPEAAERVFSRHGDAHLAPGLELVDQQAHGQRLGIHRGLDPVREDVAALPILHRREDAAAREKKKKKKTRREVSE